MVEISWSAEAQEDLRSIAEYIEIDSVRAAEKTVSNLYMAIERLRVFPMSGRIVPELQIKSIREVIEGNYRIVYLATTDQCSIVAVIHSKQDLIKHLITKHTYDS